MEKEQDCKNCSKSFKQGYDLGLKKGEEVFKEKLAEFLGLFDTFELRDESKNH